MHGTFLLALLVCCVYVASGGRLSEFIADRMKTRFGDFQKKFGRRTNPNGTEQLRRMSTFAENFKKLEELKAKYKGVELGLTPFMDWTDDEKTKVLGSRGFSGDKNVEKIKIRDKRDAAAWKAVGATVDWRLTPHMPPVTDQGLCGSCYAFATANAIAVQYSALGFGNTQFSEQQLVDCVPTGLAFGCKGGYVDQVMSWSVVNGNGVRAAKSYPYTGLNGTCMANPTKIFTVQKVYFLGDVYTIQHYVQYAGPVVVSLFIPDVLYYYTGGILQVDPTQCTATNNKGAHAMSIVGWGTENGVDYWLLRNSWGPTWGENGYVRMVRGKNVCSMETWGPMFPYLKGQTI